MLFAQLPTSTRDRVPPASALKRGRCLLWEMILHVAAEGIGAMIGWADGEVDKSMFEWSMS